MERGDVLTVQILGNQVRKDTPRVRSRSLKTDMLSEGSMDPFNVIVDFGFKLSTR